METLKNPIRLLDTSVTLVTDGHTKARLGNIPIEVGNTQCHIDEDGDFYVERWVVNRNLYRWNAEYLHNSKAIRPKQPTIKAPTSVDADEDELSYLMRLRSLIDERITKLKI